MSKIIVVTLKQKGEKKKMFFEYDVKSFDVIALLKNVRNIEVIGGPIPFRRG